MAESSEKPRDIFFGELLKYAVKDPSIVLLYGDVAGSFMTAWERQVPDQIINCGPAEQNMILVAAGLAKGGMKPYCFSIIPFLVYRPLEMIRIYLGYQRLPVRLVGVGANNSYKEAGFTHWSGEDLQTMRAAGIGVWDFTTIESCAALWVRNEVKRSVELKEPLYIRLGR